MLRSAFVLSGAAILQHRACLGTEPASAPNLVRCYYESRSRVNGKCHFGTRAAVGECSSQWPTLARPTDANFENSLLIHCSSLFFLAEENREFP